MQSSSASTKAPSKMAISKVLFGVIVIVLLVVGFGAGYLLTRPSTTPSSVNNLARPSTFPRVDGWYKNGNISYLDYGMSANVSQPILVFFQAASPDTPVAGQRNIIDNIPGQPGYSDFWRVHKVLAPSSYVANTIRSFEEAVASGYTIQATNTIVNCPVVNPNATTPGTSSAKTLGWYRGREVTYFDHGPRSPGLGFIVQSAPLYAFFYSNGISVAGQRNVVDVKPGDLGYSDLWHVTKVVVGASYVVNSLRSASDIMTAVTNNQASLQPTNMFVNCPIVT